MDVLEAMDVAEQDYQCMPFSIYAAAHSAWELADRQVLQLLFAMRASSLRPAPRPTKQ